MYPDKFHLTKEQNRRFAKKNLVRLVFTNSRFEGGKYYLAANANDY